MTTLHSQPARGIKRLLGAAIVAVVSLHAVQRLAAEGTERAYDPPVGSRWIIETETSTDENRPDGRRTSLVKARAELVIEAKTADGFRVTYTRRGTTAEGNAPGVPIIRASAQALDNVAIHATTDQHGRPLRVDNLDEAKAAIRNMAASITAPFQDKPLLVNLLNQMMTVLTDVDAEKAAATYLDELPSLAKAQSTGMQPGEVRRASDEIEVPLGGTLKSNSTFELTAADPASGRRVFVNTKVYDPESMTEFTQALSRRVMTAAGAATPEQIDKAFKSMELSLDERTQFEVEDGMTRTIEEKSVTTVHALGKSMQKTEIQTTRVTPAP